MRSCQSSCSVRFSHLADERPTTYKKTFADDTPKLSGFLIEYWREIKSLDSPEIAAAYLEVVNLVRVLPRPKGVAPLGFEYPEDNARESALLRAQRVVHEVHSIAESNDPVENLGGLLLGKKALGVNTIVAGLETIPRLWRASKLSESKAAEFCSLYRDVCLKIGPAEPRVIALQNLTDILDQLLKTNKAGTVSPTLLSEIWSSLPLSLLNPALANAVIRVSGCIAAILGKSQAISATGLENWGHMMGDAGQDDKVCNTLPPPPPPTIDSNC